MLESRWLRWVGPGVIAVGALGAIASTTLGGAGRAWAPRACDGPAPLAREIGPTGPSGVAGLANPVMPPPFRLDPILDRDGTLVGQRLSIVLDGEPGERTMELPPESFAAGPFGRVVLVGSDDGTTSRLEAIDIAGGCRWPIARESAVIRRATVDAAGALVFETRVDRAGRGDLGVWRRSIDGTGAAHRVLAPLGPDVRFGRTFSTEFTWDTAGRRLAVQACGEIACRTRIIDPDRGPATTLEAPDLGPLLGLEGDRVVTYAACRGLPCPIVSTDLRTGLRRLLARDGGPAVVLATPDGARVVDEVFDGVGRRLRAVSLDGRPAGDLGPIPGGLRLRTAADWGGGAARPPSGWVVLAPDEPSSARDSSIRPQLRHVPDGLTVPFDEAAR